LAPARQPDFAAGAADAGLASTRRRVRRQAALAPVRSGAGLDESSLEPAIRAARHRWERHGVDQLRTPTVIGPDWMV
jgi:hypothetical protein